jgi:molybdopterin-guanine dinucleotide biosynthesis protein A
MAGDDLTIVILAGGRATRLPGKLEIPVGGEPLLARVYHNLRGSAPVVIAGSSFGPDLDAILDCPVIIDRWPGQGPLAALLSASGELHSRWLFAVAGDAPHVTPNVMHSLLEAREDGDEAVVAEHQGQLEPLAALYDREALSRHAPDVLHDRNGSMHALLDQLRVRRVQLPPDYFFNINTPADLNNV